MKYTVLYTKHVRKKHKTWLDGFCVLTGHKEAILTDEEGTQLASTVQNEKILRGLREKEECLDIFDGFLVTVDGPCSAQYLPMSAQGQTNHITSQSKVSHASMPHSCHLPIRQGASQHASLRALTSRRKRGTFWVPVKKEAIVNVSQHLLHHGNSNAFTKQKALAEDDSSAGLAAHHSLPSSMPDVPSSAGQSIGVSADQANGKEQRLLSADEVLNGFLGGTRLSPKIMSRQGCVAVMSNMPLHPLQPNAQQQGIALTEQSTVCSLAPQQQAWPHDADGEQHRWHPTATQHGATWDSQAYSGGGAAHIAEQAAAAAGASGQPALAGTAAADGSPGQQTGAGILQQQREAMMGSRRWRANPLEGGVRFMRPRSLHPEPQLTSELPSTVPGSCTGASAVQARLLYENEEAGPLQGCIVVEHPMGNRVQSSFPVVVPGATKRPFIPYAPTAAAAACFPSRHAAPTPSCLGASTAASALGRADSLASQHAVLPRDGQGQGAASPLQVPGSFVPQDRLEFLPCRVSSVDMQRTAVIPHTFTSIMQYTELWTKAVMEELNLRLLELARMFVAKVQKVMQVLVAAVYSRMSASREQRIMQAAAAAASVAGNPGISQMTPQQLQKAYVGYCADAELHRVTFRAQHGTGRGPSVSKGGWKSKRRWDGDDDEGGVDSGEDVVCKDMIFLVIKCGQQKSSAYRKGDLWVLGTAPDLQCQRPGDWVGVARSLWHGPNKDGKMEVSFVGTPPGHLPRTSTVFALHGPQAATELAMLDTLVALRKVGPVQLPCMQLLLQGPPTGTAGCPVPGDVTAVAREYGLNDSQAEVVAHAAAWRKVQSGAKQQQARGLCVIHGPFGTGKSTVLVAIIQALLCKQKPLATVQGTAAEPTGETSSTGNRVPVFRGAGRTVAGLRVLVASCTNVAVDRVLLGLLDAGFTDMMRLGSLKRINKRLLPHSLHCSESKSQHADAISELKELLQDTHDQGHQTAIMAQLEAYKAGADQKRRKLLREVRVVGVTCCGAAGAGAAMLDGQAFDVLVLDECSQMVEPLALLPIMLAKPRYIVLAGDPLQLPPVVAHPAAISTQGGALETGLGRPHGYSRPLFERLVAAGHPLHLLNTQYRCHPVIGEIANQSFYSGRLHHGCSAAARQSVLPDALASITWVDVEGQEQAGGGQGPLWPPPQGAGKEACAFGTGSLCNPQEAKVVGKLVQLLLEAGVEPDRVGVICCYKRQVAMIQQELLRAPMLCRVGDGNAGDKGAQNSAVQVATVDSFQGSERDVVILSTTATRAASAGFVADGQRLNVALTRARRNLVVVGAARVMQQASVALKTCLEACRQQRYGLIAPEAISDWLKRLHGCTTATATAAAPAANPLEQMLKTLKTG